MTDHTFYCSHCDRSIQSMSYPWPPQRCPVCGHLVIDEKPKQ